MVPRDGHVEDMSAPCKQLMCWQCQTSYFVWNTALMWVTLGPHKK